MGTASQSIDTNANHPKRKDFENLLREALGRSSRRTRQLDMKFREIVNDVLFNDPALSGGVRAALTTKINNRVDTEILTKLKKWIAGGKKLADWPFKDVEIDD